MSTTPVSNPRVGAEPVPLPGLKVNEASPCIMEGSFWAWLHPLSLMRSKSYAGSQDSACFEMWTPKLIDGEACMIMPLQPDVARLLWFEQLWPDPKDVAAVMLEKEGGHKYKPGDVVLVPDDGRLWFVGPDTTDMKIHVLADWKVNEQAIWHGIVYQSGPPKPAELTRLERAIKD